MTEDEQQCWCPSCGWTGQEDDLDAELSADGEGRCPECTSNVVLPGEDY